MRDLILGALMMLAAFAAAPVFASAIADETTSGDQAKDKPGPKAAADASTKPQVLTLPPGFKARKRGEITLYCIKGKATGTRFQTEACYDEAQLRDYIIAREQNNRDFDQRRAVCQNPRACGMP